MNFKEWLEAEELEEQRFKGLARNFAQQNPNMPNYVRRDLYNTRIAHTMGNLIKNSSNPSGQLPSDSPTKIFSAAGLKNIQWTQSQILSSSFGRPGVTPNNFTERTKTYFLHRRFGFREEKQIRNDSERMNVQNRLMKTRPEGTNEPVIVIQTPQGYELLEGWHRMMNYLLRGAPPDQVQELQNGGTAIDFSKWSPVKIQAYVGRSPEMAAAYAGTGQYEMT